MSKRKRDQLQMPKPPFNKWDPIILKHAYICHVIRDDLVEELMWMHSVSPIDNLAKQLIKKIMWRNHPINVPDIFPARIMIWLVDNFPITYKFILNIGGEVPKELKVRLLECLSIISLRTLETYLPDKKRHRRFGHKAYLYHSLCGDEGPIYNYALSVIIQDPDNWWTCGILPKDLIEHYLSAYIAFTVELMDNWTEYCQNINYHYNNSLLSEYTKMHKL